GPNAVVLSTPTPPSVETLRDTVTCLRAIETSGTEPLIGYGGAVFEEQPELRDTVDALYLGKDARRAQERLEQALHTRYQEVAYSRA
ncbi:MAG TPA: hypothetical protein VGR22_10050, partial [Thermomicrobiales bacterium]|nr:hypothetical protein [Thermomicrobiales bacterium]